MWPDAAVEDRYQSGLEVWILDIFRGAKECDAEYDEFVALSRRDDVREISVDGSGELRHAETDSDNANLREDEFVVRHDVL